MGGAFVSSAIGVPTVLYAPVAFACWLSPLFGLLWAALGWFMPRIDADEAVQAPEETGAEVAEWGTGR
jgi:NhaC family Na+:H+ antiporter